MAVGLVAGLGVCWLSKGRESKPVGGSSQAAWPAPPSLPPFPPQVFQNPHQVVTVLLLQVLGALTPSLPACLTAAMDRCSPEGKLSQLLGLYGTTVYFAHGLEAAMLPSLGKSLALGHPAQMLLLFLSFFYRGVL